MRFVIAIFFAFFVAAKAVDCVGAWTAWGPCDNGPCGGQGTQYRYYDVQIPADGYGRACPAANGASEARACTVLCSQNNCVGSWTSGPCTSKGICGSDAGTLERKYVVTKPQGPGGDACPTADGATETVPCSAQITPCVNCEGSFGPWSACAATSTACGSDSGSQTRTYTITKPAGPNGAACEHETGFVQTQRCYVTPKPCGACVGSFSDYSPCVSKNICGSAEGTYSRTYKITTPAELPSGAACPHPDGYVSVEQCAAPIRPCDDCQGSWGAWSECASNGVCGKADGKRSRTYTITHAGTPEPGFKACAATNGQVQIQACAAPITPCRGCSGSWSEYSECVSDGICSSYSGKRTRKFTVTDKGEPGGAPCVAADGYVETSKCDAATMTPCAPQDGEGGFGAFGACKAPCGTTEGTQSRTYTVTKLPAYGGKPAPYATGYVETVACTATLKPCPVNCVGSFVDGECTAKACGSSAGTMKSVFKITTPVAYGGNKCSFSDGYVKTSTCNTAPNVPCPPVDCVGSWSFTPCKARACGTTSGDRTGTFSITTKAAYGGKACEAIHGQTKTEECAATLSPCPVNCIGAFSEYTPCQSLGKCSDPSGTKTRTYKITQAAAHGGQQCNHKDGQVETVPCSDAPVVKCAAIPCQGKWEKTSVCKQDKCGAAQGKVEETFKISVYAKYDGQECEAKHLEKRVVGCEASPVVQCPIDCQLKASEWSTCEASAKCGTTSGSRTRKYTITVQPQFGGLQCPRREGEVETEDCEVPLVKCPPEDCVGYFTEAPCVQTSACHDHATNDAEGVENQIYRIKKDARYGGKACEHAHNAVVPKPCKIAAAKSKRCPIDEQGHWTEPTECVAKEPCGCPKGTNSQTWVMTRKAEFGGRTSGFAHGQKRENKCLVDKKNVKRCPNELLDAPCEDLTGLLAQVKQSRCALESILKALEK